jgi:hypothetical protein
VVGLAPAVSKCLPGCVVHELWAPRAMLNMQKPSGKWCEGTPQHERREACETARSAVREGACTGGRGGSGGGAWLRGGGAWLRGGGAWLVHGWHALESCGLLSMVALERRRGKQTPGGSPEEYCVAGHLSFG